MTTSIVPATAADLIKAAPLKIQKKKKYDVLYGAGTKVDSAVALYIDTPNGLRQAPTQLKELQMYVFDVDYIPLGQGADFQEKLNVWGHPVLQDEDGDIRPGQEVWCYTTGLSTVPARTIIGGLLVHDMNNPVHFEFELGKGAFQYVKTRVFDAYTSEQHFNKEHFDACNAVKTDHPYPDNASDGQKMDVNNARKDAWIELNKRAIDQIITNA